MSLISKPVQVTLTDDEREIFMRPPDGEGGWQTFLRALQFRFRLSDNAIVLEDDELLRANRYAYKYGGGGFENRFRAVVKAAVRAGWDQPA